MDRRTRLLVVDDDPSVRALLRDYLEGHGFELGEAATGAQMRAELERELPDAVLLDIRLPGEDGLVLARYLRERYDLGMVPSEFGSYWAEANGLAEHTRLRVQAPAATQPR